MIPYVNLESLQKPMQKHHPVVKDENYNLYSDYKAKGVEFGTAWSPTHISRKEKINRQYNIDSVHYLLPFPQSNLILTISSSTFLFLMCPLINQMLDWIRRGVFQDLSKALTAPKIRKTVYKEEKSRGGVEFPMAF